MISGMFICEKCRLVARLTEKIAVSELIHLHCQQVLPNQGNEMPVERARGNWRFSFKDVKVVLVLCGAQ